jgi:hypothetical protein
MRRLTQKSRLVSLISNRKAEMRNLKLFAITGRSQAISSPTAQKTKITQFKELFWKIKIQQRKEMLSINNKIPRVKKLIE